MKIKQRVYLQAPKDIARGFQIYDYDYISVEFVYNTFGNIATKTIKSQDGAITIQELPITQVSHNRCDGCRFFAKQGAIFGCLGKNHHICRRGVIVKLDELPKHVQLQFGEI